MPELRALALRLRGMSGASGDWMAAGNAAALPGIKWAAADAGATLTPTGQSNVMADSWHGGRNLE